MQDYGTTLFQPQTLETRSFLARTLVTIYAPNEPPDPTITFIDLPPTDPFWPYANVAVKLGWMAKYKNGKWNGGGLVPTDALDQALILAMGDFTDPIAGLANIHEEDGTPYTFADRFPYQQLARWLGFHFNHDDESQDLVSNTKMPRDEVAYSLWMATTISQSTIDSTSVFDSIVLPDSTTTQHNFTQFAFDQVGFPYIWGGEWNAASPPGYCCGSQPIGGHDCSGFMWFVLKKNEDGYNAAQFHPLYVGWSLHERTSSEMAEFTPSHVTYANLAIGNLMFFASDGGSSWEDVDHVGMYVGNGWMMHSTDGGPQLQWVGDGYYHDEFLWGRGLKSKSDAPRGPAHPLAGDRDVGHHR